MDYQDKIKQLEPISYYVTQESGTERPFTGQYDNFYEKGIYVDIVSGEALFSSKDKFNAGCGWPSFSQEIGDSKLVYKRDQSHGMERTEVRSPQANSHLGHVFTDGPSQLGGLRYCINSAALKFIPYDQMDQAGYSAYKNYVE